MWWASLKGLPPGRGSLRSTVLSLIKEYKCWSWIKVSHWTLYEKHKTQARMTNPWTKDYLNGQHPWKSWLQVVRRQSSRACPPVCGGEALWAEGGWLAGSDGTGGWDGGWRIVTPGSGVVARERWSAWSCMRRRIGRGKGEVESREVGRGP